MKILFTDPDDPTGQRLIYMNDFLKKIIVKRDELPYFFDGVLVDERNTDLFNYIFTKEDLKKK